MAVKRSDRHALIIFIRNPQLGKVKSRIAERVGAAEALRIYERLLEHTRSVASAVEAERHVYYSDYVDVEDAWGGEYFQKHKQEDGGLGHKMHSALAEVLDHTEGALLIGSDCAQISAEILDTALEALQEHDVVLGPSMDGGYYLIGMKEPRAVLFYDMTWSTSSVLADTIHRANQLGLSIHLLPELSDIDYIEDWDKYGLDEGKSKRKSK